MDPPQGTGRRTLDRSDFKRQLKKHRKKACQMLDVGQTLTVTKGEFRRATETFPFHLTEAGFDAVLAGIPNTDKVTVPYLDFLSKFTKTGRSTSMLKRASNFSVERPQSPNNDVKPAGIPAQGEKCNFTGLAAKDSKSRDRISSPGTRVRGHGTTERSLNFNGTAFLNEITEVLGLIRIYNKAVHVKQNLCSAYQDIEKAFRAIDVSWSRFVSLDYLKSVINGFIVPLPNETFQELMNRFGQKATGKIAWLQFSEKFQDCGSNFQNRETVPMRKKTCVRSSFLIINPPGGDEAFSGDTVLQKLCRYIQDAYPSLKQAFLVLDEKGDGKITRNERHHVLYNLVFLMNNRDFQELIDINDPEQTGYLDYHEFLDLLEEKESLVFTFNSFIITSFIMIVAKCWIVFWFALVYQLTSSTFSSVLGSLDSVFERYPSSGVVSREVEEILSDKITENWKVFHTALQLCYKYKDNSSDGIFCEMLLDYLKVALSGDLNGISSQISKEKQQREEKRQTELSKKIKQIEDQANKYPQNRTVDEVIKRLKDVIQQAVTIEDSFFAYNKQSHGKINKAGLRKVLEGHGMPMDESQFNLLTKKLGSNEGLSCLDFMTILEDARLNGPGATLCNSSNHRVNYDKYHYRTAEECLNQLNDQLMEVYRLNTSNRGLPLAVNLDTSYSAFHEADSDHDGIINMLNLRQFLDSFLLLLREEGFLHLPGLLEMGLTSMLNFQEFCQLFYNQETKEVPPWLVSSYNITVGSDVGLWNLLSGKTQKVPRHLRQVNGGTHVARFKRSPQQRPSLPRARGAQEWLSLQYCSSPGQGSGLHVPWVVQELSGQKKTQMRTDTELACDHAHYYLVIKARTRWHDLARNFQEFDSDRNGIIQPRDLKKAFRFGIPITPEEFKQLWARYDTNAKGYLTLQEFLLKLGIEFAPTDTELSRHITEDSSAHLQAHYNNQQKKHSELEELQQQQTKALHVREIKKQIKDKFRDYFQDFNKAFHGVDKNRDDYVTVYDLQRILQEFSYCLDHDQFSSLLNSLGISIHDSKLPYFDFLRAIDYGRASKYQQRQKQASPPASFGLSLEQTLIKMKEIVASSSDLLYQAFSLFDEEETGVIKALEFWQLFDQFIRQGVQAPSQERFHSRLESFPEKDKPAHRKRGILSQLREAVTAGFNTIAQQFKDTDPSKDKTVSKEKFWDMYIAEKFTLDLSEEKINQIPTKYDLKKNEIFAHDDFLQSFILLKPQESSLLQRVIIQKPQKPLSPGPQTTSFFNAMLRIQPQILHCWRPAKPTFKRYHESRTGLLNIADFRQISCI
ncbi:LOW QUALITY PROTEIN: EF-hand calcium-binding domain-containing protein 6 [Rhynochetos jubatus]